MGRAHRGVNYTVGLSTPALAVFLSLTPLLTSAVRRALELSWPQMVSPSLRLAIFLRVGAACPSRIFVASFGSSPSSLCLGHRGYSSLCRIHIRSLDRSCPVAGLLM